MTNLMHLGMGSGHVLSYFPCDLDGQRSSQRPWGAGEEVRLLRERRPRTQTWGQDGGSGLEQEGKWETSQPGVRM